MSHPIATRDTQGPADRELTRRLRAAYRAGVVNPAVGDLLYRRHRAALLAYARTCCRTPQDAEDLVSEAFTRTFQAVRGGAGPDGSWRAYLLAVVRNTAIQWSACDRRTLPLPDFEGRPLAAGPGEEDPQGRFLASEDLRLAARSFRMLPERWQVVLWHTLVEGAAPHQVAAVLGITPSAVASLAFRAREGLREAYLRAHLDAAADLRCRRFGPLLGAAARRGGVRRAPALARHLAGCPSCARAYGELLDLNTALGATGAPAARAS